MRALLCLVCVTTLFAATLTAPVSAQTGDETSTSDGETNGTDLENIGALVKDPNLSEGVDAVVATSPEYDQALADFERTIELIAEAEENLEAAKQTLVSMVATRDEIRTDLAVRRRERRVLIRELDKIENHLRELAVSQYVGSGATEATNAIAGLDPEQLALSDRSSHLIEEASEVKVENRAVLEATLESLDADQQIDADRLAKLAESVMLTQNDIEDWSAALLDSETRVPELAAEVRDHRLLAIVVDLELPVVVLDAYNNAAIRSETLHPGCGVEWWMLAGIGRVESGHGTFKGSEVTASGRTTNPIIGIPLNGDSETAVITDTDGGTLDGDPIFDRAVGPMQFIPSTWAGNGLDGNDDGFVDPHNLYDAAYAAAHYLCRTAGSVTTIEGLRRGYFAYNHHDSYVNLVLDYALGYRDFEF